MKQVKDSAYNEKGKGGGDSWKAPDTSAFKNIKPEDLPEATYDYRGTNVGGKDGLPKSDYNYKGEKVGEGKKGLPDSDYNYKGDTSAGKGRNSEN
jgi:hypothetical protein